MIPAGSLVQQQAANGFPRAYLPSVQISVSVPGHTRQLESYRESIERDSRV
jgi:hypothetical protein